jgi:RNA polymerase sigma-70 factor, ECF subfamily
MADSLESALAWMDRLDAAGGLPSYHLLPAARADVLRRLGRPVEAAAAYERALALVTNPAERRYLSRRLAGVRGG